jgi:hypothetical protein
MGYRAPCRPHGPTAPDAITPTQPATTSAPSAAEIQERLAVLVANGIEPFPSNLSSADAQALGQRVRALRRERLIQFVIRAVALDLQREAKPIPEE